MSTKLLQVPDGKSLIDVLMGDTAAEEVTIVEETNDGGDPPAGDPPAGDPPAGDPPAGDPPAGDPPAGDPPAGDPPAGNVASETILKHFGGRFKSIEEVEQAVNRGTDEQIVSLYNAIEAANTIDIDEELISQSAYMRVTGVRNPSIVGVIKDATKENADPVDILLADTIISVNADRIGRISETRQEIAEMYRIEDGKPLSIEAERAVATAKARIAEIEEKAKAAPKPVIDLKTKASEIAASRQQLTTTWAKTLNSMVDYVVKEQKSVKLFDNLEYEVKTEDYAPHIEGAVNLAVAQGIDPSTKDGRLVVFNHIHNAFVASNLSKIAKLYEVEKAKQRDIEEDNPSDLSRNENQRQSTSASPYEESARKLGLRG